MAEIPSVRKFIDQLEVKYQAAVSEATWTKIGGMLNFLGRRVHQEKLFPLDGPYWVITDPQYQASTMAIFEFDAEIFNVWVYNIIAGSSGVTELDCRVKPKNSGAYTSIFATRPQIGYNAGNDVWLGVGDSVSNCTAPVLTSNPLQVNQGDGIIVDKISSQVGGENAGLIVHFRPR